MALFITARSTTGTIKLSTDLANDILHMAGLLNYEDQGITFDPDTHAPKLDGEACRSICNFDGTALYYRCNVFVSDLSLLSKAESKTRVKKIVEWIVACGNHAKDLNKVVLSYDKDKKKQMVVALLDEEKLWERAEIKKEAIEFRRVRFAGGGLLGMASMSIR